MSRKDNETAVDLAGRALEFRDTIERHFFDERGILICNVDRRTLRPFTEEDLSDAVVTLSGSTKAGRWAYEDTIFCTGMYLRALDAIRGGGRGPLCPACGGPAEMRLAGGSRRHPVAGERAPIHPFPGRPLHHPLVDHLLDGKTTGDGGGLRRDFGFQISDSRFNIEDECT